MPIEPPIYTVAGIPDSNSVGLHGAKVAVQLETAAGVVYKDERQVRCDLRSGGGGVGEVLMGPAVAMMRSSECCRLQGGPTLPAPGPVERVEHIPTPLHIRIMR